MGNKVHIITGRFDSLISRTTITDHLSRTTLKNICPL